ncbi:MAG: hypothetical protein RBT49_18620 [Bacteroidales bacterium]|jgi:hypothetical protein|nr:hypothetical protein [Bacteroidales bacterium]
MIKSKSIYKTILILFSIFISVGATAFAQDISAKAELEKDKILIGDQVKLNISVNKPKHFLVVLPEFVQKLSDTIEVIEQLKTDTTLLENGNIIIKKDVIITAFDSGSYIIAPIAILIKNNNEIDTIYTNELALTVNSVPLDTTNIIKDIKLPYSAPVTFKEALPYILGSLLILIIIAGLVYIIIKIKRKEPIFKRFKPLEPAHIIAFRDLEKLKNDKLWQNEKTKDYYTRLSDILRHYLWNRYAIRTLERTSDEILKSYKGSDYYDEKLFSNLKEIFETSDLVKFAKFRPTADENEKLFNEAYTFVDNTKLIIVEETEQTEGTIEKTSVNESLTEKIDHNEKTEI